MQRNKGRTNSDKENLNTKKVKTTLKSCKMRFHRDLNKTTGIQITLLNLAAPKQKL